MFPIKKGQLIGGLNGYLVQRSTPWINDISCFTYKKINYLLFGPARLVNSSCRPNIEFKISNEKLFFKATKAIERDSELLVYYGASYFKDGECKCSACKKAYKQVFDWISQEILYSGSGLAILQVLCKMACRWGKLFRGTETCSIQDEFKLKALILPILEILTLAFSRIHW